MAKKNNKRLSERLLGALNDIVAKQLMTTDYAHFYIDGNIIKSQGTRDALNRSDSVPTYVKATHWFDIFWYYVNIQVRKNVDSSSEIPFVSVSFFQEKGLRKVTRNHIGILPQFVKKDSIILKKVLLLMKIIHLPNLKLKNRM